MLADSSWRMRRARRRIDGVLYDAARRVDMGVVLRVVVADPDGEEVFPGMPRLRVLREHRRGGVLDTARRVPEFVGPSEAPVVWYCSVAAERVILHPDEDPLHQLVYGAMGAGKTYLSAQWLAFRVLERVGTRGEFGATAPTADRFGELRQAILDLWPAPWRTWRERRSMFHLATGHRVRFVTTTQKSRETGSPVQNWNWLDAVSEEIQDSHRVDGDIEARGRKAPRGRYRRLANATAKDDPDWRTWRDRILATSVWVRRTMSGLDSPFVDPSNWERLKETMTEREYQRKVLAQDVPPELLIFTAWSRDHNCRDVPQLGCRDVTRQELARFGADRAEVLVGHDPGRVIDASILLKAYELYDDRLRLWTPDPVWFVVGELTTERETTEQHVTKLLRMVRERWGYHQGADSAEMFVRIDPYSTTGADDDQPDLTVLRTFQNAGVQIRPAAYRPGSNLPGKVQPEARWDLLNTLFRSASGLRRLFVARGPEGPCAPRLVEALERAQRGPDGKEAGRKGRSSDYSHWHAALSYGLWAIERPRLDARRAG